MAQTPPDTPDLVQALSELSYEESLVNHSEAAEASQRASGPRSITGAASTGFRCLPSCSPIDGRFLAVAGANLVTLSGREMNLQIAVPAGSSSFTLGIFDGDVRATDGSGVSHWDIGVVSNYEYTLYADPLGDGTGTAVVAMQPGFPSVSSSSMPDNAWIDFTVATDSGALSPSGNYFYRLSINLTAPTLTTLNAFKIRATAVVSGLTLDPDEEPFSYIASFTSVGDAQTVYPNYPASNIPANYTGEFDFYFDLPVSKSDIAVWDGDFDRGKYNGTESDTDDPDTPGLLFLPDWATLDTLPEGIAIGVLPSTGNPPDDRNPAPTNPGQFILKSPSVRYDLSFPDGQSFANENPSGNQEWEQFKVTTDTHDAAVDHHTASIPAGTYHLRVQGVDMQNLNALLLPGRLLCLEDDGSPCAPLRPFRISSTVFSDCSDENGEQGGGEPGLEGVTIELVDELGHLVATTVTDADGHYSFAVESETYSVRIAESNLTAGGPLERFIATTPSRRTVVIVDSNNLSSDFAYCGAGSIGDLVWLDENGDGIQDLDEPGIPDVFIELVDEDGNVVDQTITDSAGAYVFVNVAFGTYTVRIDPLSLPEGVSASADRDGIFTPNAAAVTLAPGENLDDVDFGYTPSSSSIGDRIWLDRDGDTVQDADETGIPGVTIRLLDSGNTVIATTTSGVNGIYIFEHLRAGNYKVVVDPGTLPAGAVATFDADGVGTLHATAVQVAADAQRTDIDFGYRGSASLGDRVWNDLDGDTVQDSGEPGINGVTVQLFDGTGNLMATTTTAGNGNYTFANLLGGTYSVRIVPASLPSGASPTFDLDGIGTPHAATVSVAGGATRADVDFGYRFQAACTAGYVKDHFNTASFSNNDGSLSWAGAWIESDSAGAGVSSGNITVGSPYAGYLFLRDSPDTGTQPSAAREANLTGFTTATLSFYFHVRTAVDPDDAVVIEISKNGGSTWTVLETLNGFTGTDEGARSYDISSYIASNTRIRFRVSANYGASDELFKVDWVKIDGTCTPAPQTGSIGNRVWNDTDGDGTQDSGETGINGVTVQLLNSSSTVIATAVTAGNGDYTFTSVAAGSYTVKIVSSSLPAGMVPTYDLDGTGTAHTAAVTLTAGQVRTDADFGYRTPPPSCTAGYVKDHFSTASFSNNDGSLSWTGAWVESDVAGTGVSSGNVTVGTPYSGYLILRDNPDTGTQPSAARQANLAGFASATLQLAFHTTSGVDPDDAAVVEVSGNGGASYTVLATLTGITGATTGTRTYNISSYIASNTRVRFRISSNYGADSELFKVDWVRIDGSCSSAPTPQTGSIGDRVWFDRDGDKVQDSGETGINGATVQLLNSSGGVVATTTTAGNGNYSFSNMAAGNYSVKVVSSTLPAGALQTHDLDGTGTAHQTAVALTAGQSRTDADFGYKGNLSIGDRVWNDKDADRSQDSNEPGIGGVTVKLYDAASNLLATATTNSSGNYSFANLLPGTYTVKVVSSTLPSGVTQTYDKDGTSTAHAATFAVTANRSDIDFGYKGSQAGGGC